MIERDPGHKLTVVEIPFFGQPRLDKQVVEATTLFVSSNVAMLLLLSMPSAR